MSDTSITRVFGQGMVTLKGDLESAPLISAVTEITGQPMVDARQIHRDGQHGLAWMAPDELLLLLPNPDVPQALVTLAQRLSGLHHLAADVSDARAVFRLSGDPRRILGKGSPADMRPAKFAPGEIRRTRLGQVAVAFWLTDQATAELVCFTSVGGFVTDWLTNAAA
ncbi:MAG: sarcosine oxidase subunit gamma family protein [Pseudomonadota bacterium]